MTTVRQKVLAHLKKQCRLSAGDRTHTEDVCAQCSAPFVGSVLRRAGWILLRSITARGVDVPEKMYSLSEAALGDNLSALTNALLAVAGSRLNVEPLANHILDAGRFASLPITKRLALLVEKLNEMHYQAHWEAGSDGPRVIPGRCPYAKVIAGHPEICKMDAMIMSGALGRSVVPSPKNNSSGRGACPFVFQVK